MSENRRRWRPWRRSWLFAVTVGVIFQVVPLSWGNPSPSFGSRATGGQSPVVVLSGEFFQAMEKLSSSGIVSGDRQELFLEQIATAQRFVVKTNLTLIEQNEKIIKLLEDLKRQGQKESH
jgi:hypothetical protein